MSDGEKGPLVSRYSRSPMCVAFGFSSGLHEGITWEKVTFYLYVKMFAGLSDDVFTAVSSFGMCLIDVHHLGLFFIVL